MLNKTKSNIFIMHRGPVLCGLLFAAVLALLPTSAGAQCTNWDASGVLEIAQRGQVGLIGLKLEQKGRVLTGTAENIVKKDNFLGVNVGKLVKATVDGTIDADRFSVQIFWQEGLTGVYNGKVLPSGRIDGETYDKNNPKTRQTWHTEGVLKCAPLINPRVVLKPAPPPPKPIKSSGKMPKREAAAPKLEPPYIIASQAVFPFPGAQSGFVVLTWDGGPNHPYAEVWVKVNGGDETKVVEQGKGGRQVIGELGKTYLYILTDDGKTLATVGVVAVPR